MSLVEHPDYHEGFFDCLDGKPLVPNERSSQYEAGWRAAAFVYQLSDDDFLVLPVERRPKFH